MARGFPGSSSGVGASGGDAAGGSGAREDAGASEPEVITVIGADGGVETPVCDGPRVPCSDRCVNTTTDADNCGQCGHACGSGRTCQESICNPDWVATPAAPGALVARERSSFGAADGNVFVWGGADATGAALQSGGMYDVGNNRWTNVPVQDATPSARVGAAIGWTGTQFIVWGGGDSSYSEDYADGARFDPGSSTWLPMSATDAPSGRRAALMYSTAAGVLVWGGVTHGAVSAGSDAIYFYDPVGDAWTVASATGSGPPGDLFGAAVAFSGSTLIVAGGASGGQERSEVYEYDVAAAHWSTLPSGPSARRDAFGVWDGGGFLVWGGRDAGVVLGDGQRWLPDASNAAGGAWAPVADNAAFARAVSFRVSGWGTSISPGQSLILGGALTNGYAIDGAVYDAVLNGWTPVAAWPSAAQHQSGVGVWSGAELVLWGGMPATSDDPTVDGERWRP